MNTLLPCPFCGSSNIVLGYFGQPATVFFLSCRGCGACGPKHAAANPAGGYIPSGMNAAWNTRVPVVTTEGR